MSAKRRWWRRALIAALLCLYGGAGAAFLPAEANSRRQPTVGQILWPANGIGVCVSAGSQNAHNLVSDGLQGAIMVWSDARPTANGADIYAQRLNAGGMPLWAVNGLAVIAADNDQSEPEALSDGAGARWWRGTIYAAAASRFMPSDWTTPVGCCGPRRESA